jgi:hypothetical protein
LLTPSFMMKTRLENAHWWSLRAALTLAAAAFVLADSYDAHASLDEVLPASSAEVSSTRIAGRLLRVRVRDTVKEFADASGKVFAVCWRGSPDLRLLLGTHFASYRETLRAQRPRSLHFVRIVTPELIATHMVYGRLSQGQAVLVKRLPKGVTLDALR